MMDKDDHFRPESGLILGPFVLGDCLAKTLLGSFFKAGNRVSGEPVCLHVLPPSLSQADPDFIATYKQRIAEQTQLAQPLWLKVREVHHIADRHIVEYETGPETSLAAFAAGQPEALPLKTVQTFIGQAATGLQEAAKIHQGHYFLAPEFFFLDGAGNLRLLGLGLFQSIDYAAFEEFVSVAIQPIQRETGAAFFNLEVLAPEIRDTKGSDPRSDFYGLGILAFYLLTRAKPDAAHSPPSTLRADIPEAWDRFVGRCLEPRPKDRFAHYNSLLQELEKVSGGGSRSARSSRKAFTKNKPAPKPASAVGKVLKMVMALLVLGLFIGAGVYFIGLLAGDGEGQAEGQPMLLQTAAGANLVVEGLPPAARIRFPERRGEGLAAIRDTAYVVLPEGAYRVEVSAPGRQTRTYPVTIVEGGEPVRLTVDLDFAFVPVRFTGVPGTEVHVEIQPGLEIYLGRIDRPEGRLIEQRLLSGSHRFTARHPWYEPLTTEPVLLEGEEVLVAFTQVARPAEILLNSKPDGATVLFNGQVMGSTPLSLEKEETEDSITLILRKQGYREASVTFGGLEEADVLRRSVTLEPEAGEVKLDLQQPFADLYPAEAFTLKVDGKAVPWPESGSLILNAGRRELTLEHPDFRSLQEVLTITDRVVLERQFVPEPLPARVRPLVEEGRAARFVLDGKVSLDLVEGQLLVPPGKERELSAQIPNYHTVVQVFDLLPNREVDWRIPLKPLPGPEPGEDYLSATFNLNLLWMAPATFDMSSPLREFRRLPNEDEPTRVTLSYGFWILDREVTQALFSRVMRRNPSQFPGPSHPVDSVSHELASAFCQRLSELEEAAGRLPEGFVYRLPTEAEWAFAARANTETPFSFGSEADPTMGNFQGFYRADESAGQSGDNRYGTLPVASFPPNPFGLYDVHGNVAEWTADRYWDRLPGGSETNWINLERGRGFTVRGGSWRDSADRVRTAAREGAPPDAERPSLGFRFVLAPRLESLQL